MPLPTKKMFEARPAHIPKNEWSRLLKTLTFFPMSDTEFKYVIPERAKDSEEWSYFANGTLIFP